MTNQTPRATSQGRYSQYYQRPEWGRFSERFLLGKTCHECGTVENLQAHHLIYRKERKPWEYPEHELIALCRRHHEERDVVEMSVVYAVLVHRGRYLTADGLKTLALKLRRMDE